MFLITLLSGRLAGRFVEIRSLPFRVGRAAENDMILEEKGVRALHVEFIREGNACLLKCQESASMILNGQTSTEAVLRNGDYIEIGSVKLRFDLAPVVLLDLRGREMVVWAFVVAVFLVQFWVVYRLLG